MTAITDRQTTLHTILSAAPVLPVVVVDSPEEALCLTDALVAGGLTAIEITLRTPAALDAIASLSASHKNARIGAGTVTTPEQLAAVEQAGAAFAVSPGSTPALLDAAEESALPFLPGAATASEAMQLLARGFSYQKFFPAEASGGAPAVKALGAPLPDIRFCPTGGISPDNALDYLSLANVICIGGSWVADPKLIRAGQWDAVTERARHAKALMGR
ncbi:MAG: bifunctional 4-hydroxy-2-oxoglutarate aldolase/2-dehydro-3-deoxy-phosphogluconate aldolase [Pseudomonadota bacterium]